MVLIRRLALAGALGTAVAANPVAAQQIDRTAPILDLPLPGTDPMGLPLGPFRLYPSGEARVEYDSNIYAEPDNEVDDALVVLTPRVEALLDSGDANLSLLGELRLRRFFDRTAEDSDAAFFRMQGNYKSAPDTFAGHVSWRRAIEDRGDPEARDTRSTGPRRINILNSEASWTHDTGSVYVGLTGDATQVDYLASRDRDRDLSIYSAQAAAGYYLTGTVRAVVNGFYNRRDFRLATDFTGINRDADTFGVRAGVSLADTGFVRGEATVGVFRSNPDDPSLPSRTGLSAEASISYLPTRRIAFTLDGFRGDVATVRSGAQARTDTRFRLGVQAEARSDLRFQASVLYRRSKFIGTGIAERTLGVTGEVEYRLNRSLSLATTVTYANRHSDDPSQPFERTRAAVELRTQF
ncbi:outer membrane beta-barrel protein [Stakelama saccharophila]|uniref:Outer membrane beta-barrel protein n=1 Tax=Stakelama saccharophila TaxID=3075605 RepID=A0ABZ0BAA7_9SPHN|nr:outer membrane beta-barrel protein [Stakelama sp. W311]WNO54199.1 outer membrane beta-barrel protein [Stakelama sp. W311]